jgi:iron complex outermembrane receptor protein
MVDTKVGLYVDGAYHTSGNGAMFDLFDIERVEVLRGPQGTLYGRNTVGGAINIVTKRPTNEFGARLVGALGTYDQRDIRGTVNVPLLSETLLGRFAFARNLRGPFYDNDLPGGDDYEDKDSKGFRSALRWLPTGNLTVDYAFEWIKTDEHNPNFVLRTDCGSGCLDPTSALFGVPTSGLLPGFGVGVQNEAGDGQNDGDQFNRFTLWNHSVQADLELSQDVTLRSITGWRRQKWGGENDLDGTGFLMFHSGQSSFSRNFYEELQLLGNGFDGKLEYVLGGNWYEQEAHEENFSDQFIDCPACTGGFPSSQSSETVFDNYAIAGFGQATFHLTDRLSATGGMRYTTERKQARYDLCAGDPTRSAANRTGRVYEVCILAVAPAINDLTFHERFDGWSAMGRLAYDWTESIMTYATWARGYQAGGFNPRPAGGAALVPTTSPFDSEDIFSWEVGSKSRFFDNRLQANVAAYYNQMKDQQVTTFVPGGGTTTVVQNAGRSRIRGYELEFQAAPIDGLLLMFTHAWTNFDYAEFLAFNINTGVIEDVSDLRSRGHLPKRKYSGVVQYTFPATSFGELQLTGTFLREGPKNWLETRLQDAHTKSSTYTKYDARVDLRDAFGREGLRLSVIGKNITDRSYDCCQGIDFFFWQGGGFGDPVQYTFEVGYEFGGI